ncbi:DUF5786 family protein [Salarchaeum sp. JOR-1]|uniref:DUF5786 family protein n=1 Tax=Salarchaeum sp. JOR-1 TaxID=2599399 RepID=UPI00119854B2|nr:DUF5786 family protein [Salarchaeum sp. JOR-1]QDX40629.1 death domain-associated protein [Salarchaeum sp. JOR-1]
MGFGSYDESEQKDQSANVDEDAGVNVHENDHEGEVALEGGDDTDALVDALSDMKDSDDED